MGNTVIAIKQHDEARQTHMKNNIGNVNSELIDHGSSNWGVLPQ